MPKGLRFRLSEGEEGGEAAGAAPTPAPAARLSEAETERVLRRLPPLKTEASDEQGFALRERSLPPPRAGATVLSAFPADEARRAPEQAAGGALEVVRYQPTGQVPLAPQLSVTFSQPMVAVGSQEEASRTAPVEISPKPEGRWRWLGAKTVVFDPADARLPMATDFKLTVPAGTRSAAGGATRAPVTWSFSTPPPQLKAKYPEGGPVRRDALVFMEFDQRIDPAAVLGTVRVRAGSAELRTRLATDKEVEADQDVRGLASRAVKGRWLVLRAGADEGGAGPALPADAQVSVTVGPGTPSAEGPRRTETAQSFSFRTYGPLRVTGHQCGWQPKKCEPSDQWRITFSNPLDREAFDRAQVTIVPALPDAQVAVYGNELHVQGWKRGRTTYRVTLDRGLRDEFGQTLGQPAAVSFDVGPAPPSLMSAGGSFVALEASAAPRYSVHSVNQPALKVSLYAVGPEDWPRFADYMRRAHGYNAPRRPQGQSVPPGRLVYTKTVPVAGPPEELTETGIDIAPALKGGLGHAVLIVEPTAGQTGRQGREMTVRSWVQVTNIGLGAFADRTDLLLWATSMADGRPLGGVQMLLPPHGGAVTTGEDGLARYQLPPTAPEGWAGLVVARQGADTAILPEHGDWWYAGNTAWVRREEKDSLRWYVFDDRKTYRPGEEVSVKGWLRRVGAGKGGDVGPLAGAASAVAYVARDERGNEVARGAARLNALGGFDLRFKLPPTVNLGSVGIQFDAQGGDSALNQRQHQHYVQAQEFRRPEFEVKASAEGAPHFVGGHAQAVVAASYYAGGGLPNAEVNWRVTASPTRYTPPNRGDYTFGKWVPWWGGHLGATPEGQTNVQTYKAQTDSSGKHRLRLDFDSVDPPQPSTVTAQAGVTDVNRQTWAGATTMLVHPSELYVGLKSGRTFVQQGEPLVVETIVTDLDGRAVQGREVRMRAALLEWTFTKGEWRQAESKVEECRVASGADAVRCTFRPQSGGAYRVTARVIDDRERPNESELTLWVAGGKQPPRRGVEQESVELIPDRREYAPGETAEILVQAPFAPAEGVLTLRRSGLERAVRFHMDGPSHTLRVPVEEAFTPNVHAQVDLVGAAPRADGRGEASDKLPKRPAFASGSLNLSIPPAARRLQVTAVPRDKALEPGAETSVTVEVKDAAGRAVQGSDLAVVVVDESVLALSGFRLEDPLSVFYTQRGADVTDHHLRRELMLRDPGDLTLRQIQELPVNGRAAMAPMAAAAGAVNTQTRSKATLRRGVELDAQYIIAAEENNEAPPPPAEGREIRVRSDFNALAVFVASAPTDAAGRAEVKVKVPDSLTRYRVMAVSVAGGRQFGSGESNITARMPLMVRPSAPRFLNFGDRFELPVVVQNQTDAAVVADVAVRASNAELTEGQGRRVTVPANDRVEVRFPVAASMAGTARFQAGAVAGTHSDAAQVELPVWTPATTEAFATYGEVDAGGLVVQPVKAPADVFKQFGGLEVQTSSTQLQALTDAVLYLTTYPYECSEQLASRVLGVAALRDVLSAFKAKDMPTPDEMKAAVARDIKRLQGMQNDDGGFGFWRRGEESWPYVSLHVAHALARAKEKGYDVPQAMLDNSKSYLRSVENRIPKAYGRAARNAVVAYALNVRLRLGDRDAARARRLIAEEGLEKLSLESVGWLLPVLSGDAASAAEVAAIRRLLGNRVEETAGAAHFTSRYADDDYLLLASDRRADAVILEALIGDQPASDLIPKIVRGLLAHRKKGRWENTQENVFVLLALDRYFNTYEKTTPDFVARAWLGESYAGEQQFRGRSTDRREFRVPMRRLAEAPGGAQQNLTISKEGAGRLYYRIGMQYAPASLKLAPADYGFTVERSYEAVDNPSDVRRDADGTWRVRAGAKVRVKLSLYAPARRYHVALTDPLPAGLEALNPALAVTEFVPEESKTEAGGGSRFGWWWWRGVWYEHQNLRDERAEAFTSLLWEGVYTYAYTARATTPGAFVVPPAKAEEMYHPETFGRGQTDRLVVE